MSSNNEPNNQQEQQESWREQQEGKKSLINKNKRYAKGFTIIPNWIITNLNISMGAKLLYGLLQYHAWQSEECFPGYETLMAEMQCSRQYLSNCMKELRESGLIEVERRGLGLSNIYRIVDWTQEDFDEHLKQKSTIHTSGSLRSRLVEVRHVDANNTQIEKDTELKRRSIRKRARARESERETETGKVFREANASKTEMKENQHVEPMATGKRKEEAETREQKGRGVTFSPDKERITNRQDVQGRAQQVTPASMIPKSGQENTERSTNVPPLTKNQAQASKQRAPAYIGKPLTQEEIDKKRREGKNASGFTPIANIIPATHWQELQAQFSSTHEEDGNGNGNGLHYHQTTKHAPVFIDACIEEFTKVLHDEEINTAENINRTAKLYRLAETSEEVFRTFMFEALNFAKKYPSELIRKRRPDGLPNKMPFFFSKLEELLGLKKPPN